MYLVNTVAPMSFPKFQSSLSDCLPKDFRLSCSLVSFTTSGCLELKIFWSCWYIERQAQVGPGQGSC